MAIAGAQTVRAATNFIGGDRGAATLANLQGAGPILNRLTGDEIAKIRARLARELAEFEEQRRAQEARVAASQSVGATTSPAAATAPLAPQAIDPFAGTTEIVATNVAAGYEALSTEGVVMAYTDQNGTVVDAFEMRGRALQANVLNVIAREYAGVAGRPASAEQMEHARELIGLAIDRIDFTASAHQDVQEKLKSLNEKDYALVVAAGEVFVKDQLIQAGIEGVAVDLGVVVKPGLEALGAEATLQQTADHGLTQGDFGLVR